MTIALAMIVGIVGIFLTILAGLKAAGWWFDAKTLFGEAAAITAILLIIVAGITGTISALVWIVS